jgi:hypothetical protein
MLQQRLRCTGAFEVEFTDDGTLLNPNATSTSSTAVLFSRLTEQRMPAINEITAALAASGLECVGTGC